MKTRAMMVNGGFGDLATVSKLSKENLISHSNRFEGEGEVDRMFLLILKDIETSREKEREHRPFFHALLKILNKTYPSSGLTLTWPKAFSSIIRCSIDATSLRVNAAASGLIKTESIPALTINLE